MVKPASVTMQQVAAEARVSIMTVSNVLNGRHGRAAPETVERVMVAVERLGYVRNGQARALSSARSNLIALVYPPAPHGDPALINPHDAIFLSEVERRVTETGRHLIVHNAVDVATAALGLRTWRVDGAVFLRTFGEEVERVRERIDLPIVFVDNYSLSPLVSKLGVDDHLGGELAGECLAQAGHRRVGFVGPEHGVNGVVRQRYLGFRRALADHGVSLRPEHDLRCDATFEDGVSVARRLAADPARPTAIFATADIIAAGLLKGFVTAGLPVPDHVSLVGFDDLPICRHVTPELTTVRQDIPAKARATIDLLVGMLESWPDAPTERIELGVKLVERASVTGPWDETGAAPGGPDKRRPARAVDTGPWNG
jgi:LacI family transcriptional regulator